MRLNLGTEEMEFKMYKKYLSVITYEIYFYDMNGIFFIFR